MTTMNDYSDIERALLQFIISTHPCEQRELIMLHNKFTAEYVNETMSEEMIQALRERHLDESIELINNKLHPLGFEITHTKSQTSGSLYYCYVNTQQDSISQAATTFSKSEIECIKNTVEELFTNPEETYHVSSTRFMRICQKENKTPSQAEQLMRRLISDGWFDLEHGHLALGIRSLAELKRQLINDFGVKSKDTPNGCVAICSGCKDIVTKGIRGTNCREGCWVRFHTQCKENYDRARRDTNGANVCPGCSQDWESVDVGAVSRKADRQF